MLAFEPGRPNSSPNVPSTAAFAPLAGLLRSNAIPPEKSITIFSRSLGALLILFWITLVAATIHWPLVGDATLFHYIVFLMHHGMAPYREIKDLNLPGTYAAEATVMSLFGTGPLAWRLWDLTLTACIAVCICVVSSSPGHTGSSRLAPIFAATLFALIHARDGIIQLGQRDLLLTTLLLVAYALLFHATRNFRKRSYPLLLLFGACIGAAATVKPFALLILPALLAWLIAVCKRQTKPWLAPVLVSTLGASLPCLAALFFLQQWHALASLLDILRTLAPLHIAILRLPWTSLLFGSVSSVLLPLFLLWMPVFVLMRRQHTSETVALLIGAAFGVVSFCLQGRGYPYHRYPLEAFLLILISLDLTSALASHHWLMRSLAYAGLVFGAFVIAPRSLWVAAHYDWRSNQFDQMLQADLAKFTPADLEGHTQCLDMAGGCITTLYRRQIVQSTGYLYDCYAFIPVTSTRDKAEQAHYRAGFAAALLKHPPRVLIVTSDECGITPADFSYHKLDYWPELKSWLAHNYILADERVPDHKEAWQGKPALPYGFRLYLQVQPSPVPTFRP